MGNLSLYFANGQSSVKVFLCSFFFFFFSFEEKLSGKKVPSLNMKLELSSVRDLKPTLHVVKNI